MKVNRVPFMQMNRLFTDRYPRSRCNSYFFAKVLRGSNHHKGRPKPHQISMGWSLDAAVKLVLQPANNHDFLDKPTQNVKVNCSCLDTRSCLLLVVFTHYHSSYQSYHIDLWLLSSGWDHLFHAFLCPKFWSLIQMYIMYKCSKYPLILCLCKICV